MKKPLWKNIFIIHIYKISENFVFNCRVVRDLQKHVYSFQVNYSYEFSNLYPLSQYVGLPSCASQIWHTHETDFLHELSLHAVVSESTKQKVTLADWILWSNLEQNIALCELEAAVRAKSNTLDLVDLVKTEALEDISKPSPS